MSGIFKWIGAGLKGFGKTIALPFLKVRSSSRLQSVFRWTLHVVCVALVLAGLWYLNYAMKLDTVLLTPYPALRNCWLPLVFVQLYAISWTGWWLCRLLTIRKSVGDHPDLDRAWRQVESSLRGANIDVTATPLYMFLGKPQEGMTSFFNAGQVVRTVSQVPSEEGAPIQVFANEDAIYLCCEDTCLLGRQSDLFRLAEKRRASEEWSSNVSTRVKQPLPELPVLPDEMPVGPAGQLHFDSPDESPTGGVLLKSPAKLQPNLTHAAESSLALIDSNIALLEKEEDLLTPVKTRSTVYQPSPKINLPLLQNEAEIEATVSRLDYLCRIIESARAPFCPINGIVVLLPYSASESDDVANHTGMLVEQDLEVITSGTNVEAPRIAVICDIQNVTGCVELLDRFPENQRHRRLGIKIPKTPSCERDKVSKMIYEGLTWLCQKMVPPLVNRLFHTERTVGNAEESVNEANRRLYRFMSSIRDRQKTFERLMRRAFLGNNRKDELLRGCYLSASGRDSLSEQGFTAGIFNQILEMQNDVAWTQKAIERDEDFRRWTTIGYSSVVTVVVVAILMIVL